MKYEIKEDGLLIDFLYKVLNSKSKNNIKTILKNGVYVNDKITTKYNYKLTIGDTLRISNIRRLDSKNQLDIIYEDKDFLVINKPYGLLTIATEKEKEKTLYHYAFEYLKGKREKLFIVHRLDKDTSGVVLFAKSERLKHLLQKDWNHLVTKRGYVAVVHGNNLPKQKALVDYLNENKNYVTYITDKQNGKIAITEFKTIKSNNSYSLIDIDIKTGRKNQIRVQLSSYDHPIVGDKKYGKKDTAKRLYLHATMIKLIHPITSKEMEFTSQVPSDFEQFVI